MLFIHGLNQILSKKYRNPFGDSSSRGKNPKPPNHAANNSVNANHSRTSEPFTTFNSVILSKCLHQYPSPG